MGDWSGVEPVHHRLLVRLDAPDPREVRLQLLVHPRARVAEALRLLLDAVLEDHADAGERVLVELRVGDADEVLPGELLPVERDAPLLHEIETQGNTSVCP